MDSSLPEEHSPAVIERYPVGEVPEQVLVDDITIPVPEPKVVIRTSPRWDSMVEHLGYESVSLPPNTPTQGMKTDLDLIAESQERLKEVKIIPDSAVTAYELASLNLARAISQRLSPLRPVRRLHAAIIPPASDRVRTAGLYGRGTQQIYISAEQLRGGRAAVDTLIHELAHHTSGAEDGEEAHNAELSRIGGLVVSWTANRVFDQYTVDPAFEW